jgi:threonine dehydrogenase-like Zn-dependent dehydrogenase
MRALTVRPGVPGSAEVREVPEPLESDGPVLVETLAVGLCGTDAEIVRGEYGQAPPGADHLVLGHENLGRVLAAPAGSGLAEGDPVVGIVRRPDPVPCAACAAGEWDFCRNGLYTEHGIKQRHGFARDRWRTEPDAVVKLDPRLGRRGVLLEPTTVLAKAWEQVERAGRRGAGLTPRIAAVIGAGPVGLLGALLGVQRGLEVHVLDVVEDGPKPALVRDLGATYHSRPLPETGLVPDVVLECTGIASVVVDAITCTGPDGITCLTGVSPRGRRVQVDVGSLNREVVLQNDAIIGSVNANRRHYQAGAEALSSADEDWLDRLVTRRLPLQEYAAGLDRTPSEVKVVLELTGPDRTP